MNKQKWFSLLGAYALLASMALTVSASRPLYAQGASRTFTETGKTVSGRFLEYWIQNGGLAQQGFPITEELQETSDTDGKVYKMQYFQRAVFEHHPQNARPNDVLLSLLGVFYYNEEYHGSAPNQHTSTDNPRLFNETGWTIGGAFRRYWETHGGLAQQGFPISEEFEEVSPTDGKTYTVQYFQRAVFEYHPEFAGTQYEVLLSLLGVFYHGKKHGPSPPKTPVPTPVSQPTSTPAPPNNTGQVIFYNDSNGSSAIGRVDAFGNYENLKNYNTFSASWTHIVPLGNGRLLFYRRNNGLTVVGDVGTDGTYTDKTSGPLLTPGWTHLAPAGNGLFLYYRQGTHTGGSARVNPDGTITNLKVYTTFSSDWTHIVGLDNGVLLFYQRGTNKAGTLRLANDGSIINLQVFNNFSNFWDRIVPGIRNTMLFYRLQNGQGLASIFDDNGVKTDLMVYPDAARGNPPLPIALPIVAGTNNGILLFYNDSDGSAVTGRLDIDGAVTVYNRYPANTFGLWTHIVGIR